MKENLTEKEILEQNIKLIVSNGFQYEDLKKICDVVCNLGYECQFNEHGTIVFMKLK